MVMYCFIAGTLQILLFTWIRKGMLTCSYNDLPLALKLGQTPKILSADRSSTYK